MEDKKTVKVSLGTVICLFIILILIIALIGMWYYYNMIQNPKTDSQNTSNLASQDTNSNTNTNLSNVQVKSLKLDDNKEWIYDAEYEKKVTANSYSIDFSTYYAKDIIVPYININSSYASASNSEIKKVFDDAIKEYNTGVNDKLTYIDECNYKKYINNDNLSVILTYGVGATDVVHPEYYTYNIDLKTGNQLSFKDVYSIAGFNSNNINSQVENAITKTLKEKMAWNDSSIYPTGTNFDTYNNKSISNYNNSITNNTLRYFLSDNGKLNVIVELNIPAGSGSFDTIITVE